MQYETFRQHWSVDSMSHKSLKDVGPLLFGVFMLSWLLVSAGPERFTGTLCDVTGMLSAGALARDTSSRGEPCPQVFSSPHQPHQHCLVFTDATLLSFYLEKEAVRRRSAQAC